MLEICFYYMTIVVTISFLVLQHFLQLEIPASINDRILASEIEHNGVSINTE